MQETPETLNNQALQLASSGDYTEAIACLRKALEMQRYNALLWYNLSITYRDCGEIDLAKEAALIAFELDEEDIDIIDTVATLYISTGDYDEAFKFSAFGTETHSENARIWNTFGVACYNLKEYDLASLGFEKAISIDPYYYDALFNLRDTYQELQNNEGVNICNEQMKRIKKQN